MIVFVTGGSGFVGSHVIEHFVARGHEVRAMARSEKSAATVASFGATPVRCDLDSVEPADLAGCHAVVHAAAFVEEWGTREAFWKANVEGTERLLAAARAADVRRFVHVGTEAAVFDGTRDLIAVDETLAPPSRHRFLYSETKAAAEARVLAANAKGRFETVSIRPRLVWGPRDTSVLPAVLRMAREGSFVWLDGGRARTSTTHVRNLAHALELALTKGKGGQAYFVADDGERDQRAFLTAYAATEGVALTARSLPGALVRGLARVVERVWRALSIRRVPPLTSFAVSALSRSVTVDVRKAKRELGYAPVVDFETGMNALERPSRNAAPEAALVRA
ncbi:MAG: NAD-dependent epimerase/dehydratase family protein [Polyangiales bacterium]|nr:NAD-dependent epimerase/dehydratase family protein [Myxococcales bacterium]MCB9622983.1 NAD-dependent epimerase/dehydratase family protein [Sandaracinus sp.]